MADEDWSVGCDERNGNLNQVGYISSTNPIDEASSTNQIKKSLLLASQITDSLVKCNRNISLTNHIRNSPSLIRCGNNPSMNQSQNQNQIMVDVKEHIAIKNDKQDKKDTNSYGECAIITNGDKSSNCSDDGNVTSMSCIERRSNGIDSDSNKGSIRSTSFDENYPYSIVGEPTIVRQGKYPDDWYIKFTGQPDLRLSFQALLPYIRACRALQICEDGRAHEYVCSRNWMWTEEEQEMMKEEARRNLTNQQDLGNLEEARSSNDAQ